MVDEAVALPAPPARNREGACQPLPERIRPRPHAWREELVARLQGGEGHRAVALAVDRGALLPLEGNVLLAGLVSRQGAELGQRIHPEGKGGLEVARVELGDGALELLESEVVLWPRRVLDSGCSCTSSAVHIGT